LHKKLPLSIRLTYAIAKHKAINPAQSTDKEDQGNAINMITSNLGVFFRCGGTLDLLAEKLYSKSEVPVFSLFKSDETIMEILDATEVVTTVAKLTSFPKEGCEKVIAAVVDVLHEEMQRRSKADPTLYNEVQEAKYNFYLGEHLEPANFLPGDFWTEVCRRSQTAYNKAEQIVRHFRDTWLTSAKFFEMLGTITPHNNKDANIWFAVSLRRDFLAAPDFSKEDICAEN
jgi:hypothetical protein